MSILNLLHRFFQFLPAWHKWDITWLPGPMSTILGTIGLIPLIIHRNLLKRENLLPTPKHEDPKKRNPPPASGCPFRPDDGFGTDIKNPTASMEGAPVGRNIPAVPKHLRNARGAPDVQMVAQRLLARESFSPAASQLNIMAAAWIQAMVHDWIQHEDGAPTSLENGHAHGCPLNKNEFFETKERPDGHFNNKRTQWWDASFVYGNNSEQVQFSRSGVDGKLKIDQNNPDVLPSRPDGTDLTGDNSNSWVGVTVLQNLFLKEHNYCAEKIAKQNPGLTDDEIFGYCRNIISALEAKIHTIDWTCELLKTKQLKIGMETNWKGIFRAVLGSDWDFLPDTLQLIDKPKGSDNNGVPFCLTEEFAAVYRLHPLLPPGLIIEHEGSTKDEFIDLQDCLTGKGRDMMRKPGMSKKVMKSCFFYPCGALVASNYADSMRSLNPTDERGVDLPGKIDLAAIDLYRDRERGIQNYNEFRRQLKLKPFKTWEEMTGEKRKRSDGGITNAQKLEAIYGPAPEGIEKCDLLVGDLYEKKIKGFAISETSFIIFLLMASRRLDADPYLNEYYDEEHYTAFGMAHIKEVSGLMDILKRHYPDIASEFPKGQSVFKPIYSGGKWQEKEHLYPGFVDMWARTKENNDSFFTKLLTKLDSPTIPPPGVISHTSKQTSKLKWLPLVIVSAAWVAGTAYGLYTMLVEYKKLNF